MIDQTKLAIAAIAIVIPLSAFAVYTTNAPITEDKSNPRLYAVASFYPLFEFAQKVGQDKVDVALLVPTGVEPHDWEPTIKDVQKMKNADFIIINGIGFETWVHQLDDINYSGIIVNTSYDIATNDIDQTTNKLEYGKHVDGYGDPHVWLNPVLAKVQVQNIANAFSDYDPQNEKFYQQNAKNYEDELDWLDKKIRNELTYCNHDFITFHDAFSYFSDEYSLNQHTIVLSNSPHAEPTAKTLAEIINTAKELNIKIIFTEETVNPRVSEIIADEIGGKILPLSPIEIGTGKSYISRMTDNLNSLKEVLC